MENQVVIVENLTNLEFKLDALTSSVNSLYDFIAYGSQAIQILMYTFLVFICFILFYFFWKLLVKPWLTPFFRGPLM